MDNFYFFTEESKLENQPDTLKYGPVVGEKSNNKYQVTSQFTTTSPSKAYAVATGKVLVQPQQGNSDLVNLLLVPTKLLGSPYTNVFCFVYRGLKKENFLDSSGIIPLNHAKSTDLTNNIREDSDGEPSTNVIGWQWNSESDSKPVDQVVNLPDDDIQLMTVNPGDYIGVFEGSTANPLGFEIVLQDKFVRYSLGDLRSPNLVIEPSYQIQPGDIGGRLTIEQMAEREKILNFIDPAAYYNTYYETGVFLNSTVHIGSSIQVQLLNKFYTSGVVYFDIRNENGYSLNYYKDDHYNSSDHTHIRLKVNNGVEFYFNYYVNFWPVFEISINNLPSGICDVNLSIYDQYNTGPFCYYDCAYNSLISDEEISFYSYCGDIKQDINDYYKLDDFYIPVINNSAASWVNKFYIGKKDYSNLPNTYPKRVHYLDYLFSSIDYISSTPPASSVVWRNNVGQKLVYLPHFKSFHIVECYIIETATDVGIALTSVDFYDSESPGIYDPEPDFTAGESDKEIDYFNSIELHNKTLVLQPDDLNISVAPQSIQDNIFSKKNHVIIVSRNEFNTYISPAVSNINPAIHDVSMCVIGIGSEHDERYAMLDKETDNEGQEYFKGIVRLKGMATNGVPAIDYPLQAVEVLTVEGAVFQSVNVETNDGIADATDENAYIGTGEIVSLLKDVEQKYFKEPNDDSTFIRDNIDHHLLQTVARIRVHSYGQFFSISDESQPKAIKRFYESTKQGIALETLCPDSPDQYEFLAPSGSVILGKRHLSSYNQSDEMQKAYNHFTAHADENGFQDNPSPYLQYPNSIQPTYSIDFGQILYGFESLVWPKMNPGYYGYHEYKLYCELSNNSQLPYPFQNPNDYYPIKLESLDFSGLIANIATPVAEYLYHVNKTESHGKGINAPISANLDFYYNISAPNADIYANADAIGVFNAYTVLKDNSALRMSDVFELYYEGTKRPDISINNDPSDSNYKHFFKAADRWKIMAEFIILYMLIAIIMLSGDRITHRILFGKT